MKFYERLNPIKRKKLVLNTVASSAVMEGMGASKAECLEELRKLERAEVKPTAPAPTGRKSG